MQLWVASANQYPYKPDETIAFPNGTGNRATAFQLRNNVALYGGFVGGETALSQRNPTVNITILSGDLNNNDVPAQFPFLSAGQSPSYQDNSFHLTTAISPSSSNTINATARLDGFRLTAGSATGAQTNQNRGGGAFLGVSFASAPTIINCTFLRNRASSLGGALFAQPGNLTIRNCRFEDNLAGADGGGIWKDHQTSTLKLLNSIFIFNHAVQGGGVYARLQTLKIDNCRFEQNNGSTRGGGLYSIRYPASTPLNMTNTSFSRNTSEKGSAWRDDENNCLVVNSTFSGNLSDTALFPGAIYGSGSIFHFENSILHGNKAGGVGGLSAQIIADETQLPALCTFTADFTDIEGLFGDGGCPGAGVGNLDCDPKFKDPANDNVRLEPVTPCQDEGDNEPVPVDADDVNEDGNLTEKTPDLDLGTRIRPTNGGFVDMGAYERCFGDIAEPENCVVDGNDLGQLLSQYTGNPCGAVPCSR